MSGMLLGCVEVDAGGSGQAVEGATVLAGHLADGVVRKSGERMLDRLARARPGAVGVREIAGPHEVVRPEQRDQLRAEGLLFEGRIHLSVEELGRPRADAVLR